MEQPPRHPSWSWGSHPHPCTHPHAAPENQVQKAISLVKTQVFITVAYQRAGERTVVAKSSLFSVCCCLCDFLFVFCTKMTRFLGAGASFSPLSLPLTQQLPSSTEPACHCPLFALDSELKAGRLLRHTCHIGSECGDRGDLEHTSLFVSKEMAWVVKAHCSEFSRILQFQI